VASAARPSFRLPAAILAGVAVSVGTYAAAGRESALGFGAALVSGTSVSHVHYRLNATNPSRIDAVAFSLAPALPGGAVAVKAEGHVYRCTIRHAGARAVCATTTPLLTARELQALSVVAAQ